MADERGGEFAQLVYAILVLEKRRPMKDVAAEMGLSYDTLYARIRQEGRVPFSADEIQSLLRTVPDARLVNYLLEGSPFIAADRSDVDGDIGANETVHRGATKTVLEATDVLREVEQSLADDKIDHQDKSRIQKEIDEAERALASLRTRIIS